MGLKKLGLDYVSTVLDVITSQDETYRKHCISRRVRLVRNDHEQVLQEQLGLMFQDEAVRLRLYQMARLSGSSSLTKRVGDDLGRPIYAQPPRRTVTLPGEREPSEDDQALFDQIAKDVKLNDVMDLVARLLVPVTSVFLVARVLEDIGPQLDLLTSDTISVVPHPKAPTVSLALVYDSTRIVNGGVTRTYVVVDDEERWEIDIAGAMIGEPVKHGYGRKPWTEIHRRPSWGSYWANYTYGQDLEVADIQGMVLDCVKLKKHKSQSHLQLAYSGDADSVVKDQTLDEESILMVNGEGSLNVLDLQADPSGLLKSMEALEARAAANYGLSMDRMNHKGGGDDDGLHERIAELTRVLRQGEEDLFDLLRAVMRVGNVGTISPEARISVDYGALHHRIDRKTQLEIYEIEERLGLASPLDPIYEKNPEVNSDEEAWAEFKKNLADRAVKIEMLRALNMTENASAEMPGQDAAANGALGPQVRDGEVTRDNAAAVAAGDNGGVANG